MFNNKKMTIADAQMIIKRIAKEEGISEAKVRSGINEAIIIASASDDPKVKKQWESMKIDGRLPSSEEFLIMMTDMVKNEMRPLS